MALDQVTIISEKPGAFNVHIGNGGPIPIQYLFTSYAPFGVSRVKDKVQGLVVNTSSHTLRVTYSSLRPEQLGEKFGPVLDYILPMQAKELGAAPNSVLWNIEVVTNY